MPTSTAPVKSSANTVPLCRSTFIWQNENGEQEYETIDESELTEDDVVVEHIHEDARRKKSKKKMAQGNERSFSCQRTGED